MVVKDNKPWILIETKLSDTKLSSSLKHFHEMLHPEYSFQVIHYLPAVQRNCFAKSGLWIVPAITFLSQLV